MEDWKLGARWLWAAGMSVGLGLAVGGLEALAVATRGDLPGDLVPALGGAVAGVALTGAVAGTVGLAAGVVHLTLRRWAPHRLAALQVALVGGGLAALFLGPLAQRLHLQGQTGPAAVLLAIAAASAGVVYFNARFLISRWLVGKARGGWTLGAAGLGGVLAVVGAGIASQRGVGGGFALDGDASVVIVTVEGLRTDRVGALGGAPGHTPALDALVARGMGFSQAISPTSSSVAAHAALWTGLHPLRHGAIADTYPVHPGLPHLAAALADEGWGTAAVLSSARVGRASGLLDAMTWVDVPDGPVPGLGAFAAGRWLVAVLAPGRDPRGWLVREDEATVDVAVELLERLDRPAVVWVHLTGPRAPWSADGTVPGAHDAAAWATAPAAYEAEVEATDAALARLLDAVDTHLVDPVVVVAGVRGQLLGEAGLGASSVGVGEGLIRVPLALAGPGLPATAVSDRQVRLLDVPNTVLAALELDPLPKSKGLDLRRVATGALELSLASPIYGRSSDGGWTVGLRSREAKVVLDVGVDARALFDLAKDPSEQDNLAHDRADQVESMVELLQPDVRMLEAAGSPPPRPTVEAVLTALDDFRAGRVGER